MPLINKYKNYAILSESILNLTVIGSFTLCQKVKSVSRGTREDRARPRVACTSPWITAFQERERKTHIRFLSRLPDVVRSAELTDTQLRRSVHAWWGKFSRTPVPILASLLESVKTSWNLMITSIFNNTI